LGEVIPNPIPLKTAKALRQKNDDSATTAALSTAASDKQYEGKRIMKGKKRASLAASVAAGEGEEGISPGKRQTRGKQVNYSADVGGDEEVDDEEEFREGDMDVDD